MNRTATALLTMLLLSATAKAQAEDSALVRFESAVKQAAPDASVEHTDFGLVARRGTMTFTIHHRSKTGEVHPTTRAVEGPTFRGFMVTIRRQSGPYDGPLIVPQTVREPYYTVYVDSRATGKGQDTYWIHFAYGNQIDETLKAAILAALPGASSFPTTRPAGK